MDQRKKDIESKKNEVDYDFIGLEKKTLALAS